MHQRDRPSAVELVPALANPAAYVRCRSALGAPFLPRLGLGLLDLRLRRLFGAKSDDSGLIGLLHGTLRVNATLRIRSFAANRAKISNRLWNDDQGLNASHVAPNAEVRSWTDRSAIRFIVPDRRSLSWLKFNVFVADLRNHGALHASSGLEPAA